MLKKEFGKYILKCEINDMNVFFYSFLPNVK